MSTQRYEVSGVRNSAGIQQHSIRDREDGDIGADAECERQHGDNGKPRRVGELANRVTKLMSDGMHSDLLAIDYSDRSACIGSMEAARRAGSHAANPAVTASRSTAAAAEKGSNGETP